MTGSQVGILKRVFCLPGRTTRAIVDLDAIASNVRRIREHIGLRRAIRSVVKADGYGHGAIMVAETALEAGAASLAVATVGEAATLRKALPDAPILILGPIDLSETDRAIQLKVDLTIGDSAFVDVLQDRALALGLRVRAHIKIDTGMHRFGVQPQDFGAALERIHQSTMIELVGVFTHHAAADEPAREIAKAQASRFQWLTEHLRDSNLDLHHANSAAALTLVPPVAGSVRLGIAMYGLAPGPDAPLLAGMRPAMSVVSRLQRIHLAEPGAGVSYGHQYNAAAPETLGLVPIGYGDGYRRAASNRGWMSTGGRQTPVRGRVCMDQTVIGDLPDDVRVGDTVGVAGSIGNGPSFDQLASWAGTINYEIATGLSPRVPRYYLREGRVVATLVEGKLSRL